MTFTTSNFVLIKVLNKIRAFRKISKIFPSDHSKLFEKITIYYQDIEIILSRIKKDEIRRKPLQNTFYVIYASS